MKTATKKRHGVIVARGKTANVKTIWNRGHRMVTYRGQPKRIRFKSPMVNDKNQHLCGGWFMAGMENTNAEIERQLIAGRKPFGVMVFWEEDESIARDCIKRLKAAGLTVKRSRGWRSGQVVVQACQDMLVGEIGDMAKLFSDYVLAGVIDEGVMNRQLETYQNKPLKHFFDRWDIEDCPPWLTGLLLGYPVENTISIYKGLVK